MAEKKTLPLTVKTEPGTYKRLPSFRTPRDLKLSEFKQTTNSNESKPKKVYVPNLNIQRRKTEESHSPAGSNDSSKLERGRRGEERGRGRGRRVPNLVQAGTGIFEQGLAASTKISRWSGGGSSNSSEPTYMQRPKLNLDNVKINKEEEELVMKELMRDDFLNDPELEPDFDNCPIKLPLQEFSRKLFIKDEEAKIECKDEKEDEVEVKTEPETEEKTIESKPVVEEKPRDIGSIKPLTVEELLAKSSDKSFMFFQLPHCMPSLQLDVKTDVLINNAASATMSQPDQSEIEDKTVLRKLPPGRIGTLKILKSGKAKLMLGDAKLWIEPGTQACFKQDLISIALNQNTYSGNMVNLGPITTRMIISPDWESLLKETVK